MVVGYEISVGRNEEARALCHHPMRVRRALFPIRLILAERLFELLEELVKGAVLRQVGQPRNLQIVLLNLRVALDLDADDGRSHLLNDISKAQWRCSKGCRACRLGWFGRSQAQALP